MDESKINSAIGSLSILDTHAERISIFFLSSQRSAKFQAFSKI